MRRAGWSRNTTWMLLAASAATYGCVQVGRVRTTVDVRAMLAPEVRAGDYLVPAGTPEVVRRSEPLAVQLPTAVRDGEIEAVGFRFAMGFAHVYGHAGAGVKLYAARRPADVFSSVPLVELHGRLEPGLERRLAREVEASERLLELVRGGELYCATEVRWQASATEDITGRYEIAQLELTLVTGGGSMLGSAAPPQPQIKDALEDVR